MIPLSKTLDEIGDFLKKTIIVKMAEQKRNKVIDPDTNEELQDAKRPKIQLDEGKKLSCLKVLVGAYVPLLNELIKKSPDEMETDASMDILSEAYYDLSVCIQITNIMFTLHTICRQEAMGRTDTNAARKTVTTTMTVNFKLKEYSRTKEHLLLVWRARIAKEDLEYKKKSKRVIPPTGMVQWGPI